MATFREQPIDETFMLASSLVTCVCNCEGNQIYETVSLLRGCCNHITDQFTDQPIALKRRLNTDEKQHNAISKTTSTQIVPLNKLKPYNVVFFGSRHAYLCYCALSVP